MRNGLVILSISVVALALGIGLHLQFALAFWLAVIAALSVYVALLSTHILIRRSEQVDELRRHVNRLETQSARPAASTNGYSPAHGRQPPQRVGPPPVDYWNYSPARPTDTRPAGAETSLAFDSNRGDGGAPEPQLVTPSQQREADAEQINAVIKKLAADITQGQVALERAAMPVAPPAVPGATTREVDASVAALHAVADAMRDADYQGAATSASIAATRPAVPPPLPLVRPNDPARSRLAAVADALERERFDVMLEPILGLGQRRAQHYVVSVRLRDGVGEEPAGSGGARSAPGSGLLPLLDAVKVESAARVAWRMEDRAKPGALFSQLSGESLVSDRFLNRFADTYRQGDTLSGRLVLSFLQSELRTFSDSQWSTLRDMADLGFRFCLDDMTTLDQDFAALAGAGFTFVRLDADVFLEGLPTEQAVVPATDICHHFTGLGLEVIVTGIADEAVSKRLQLYGVTFGQGGLFGGARPVKADVLRNPHAAVA